MDNIQRAISRASQKERDTRLISHQKKGQGVLPGCDKCMNGDVCKAMYEALKACFEMNGCHNDEESKLFDLTRNALSKAEGR